MAVCYYRMGRLESAPSYFQDRELGFSVKVCGNCFEKRTGWRTNMLRHEWF